MPLGGAELGKECGAFVFIGWGLAGDEVKSLLIPADGVVGSEGVTSRIRSAPDIAEGSVEIRRSGGRDPVMRQLCERCRVLGDRLSFERFGDALVGTGTAGR